MRSRRRGMGALIGASVALALMGVATPAMAGERGPERGRFAYNDHGRSRGYDRGRDRDRDHGRREVRTYRREHRVVYRGGFCEPWPRVRPVRVYAGWCPPAPRAPVCRTGLFFRF
ncbi:MAG: hypothetical protein R3B57_09145 [Phycisphaerales bacterium]